MAKSKAATATKGHHTPGESGGQIGALAGRVSELEQLVEGISAEIGAAKADTGASSFDSKVDASLRRQTGGEDLRTFLRKAAVEAAYEVGTTTKEGKSDAGTPGAAATARDALGGLVRDLIKAELDEIRRNNPNARI